MEQQETTVEAPGSSEEDQVLQPPPQVPIAQALEAITPEPPSEDGEDTGDGEQAKKEEEPAVEFDPRSRQDFEGLLYLGKIQQEIHWAGHRFLIRTLTSNEVLEIGLVHKDYVGTIADQKAYQALMVSAAVELVDGQPMPLPLTSSPTDTALRAKFETVRQWSPFIIDGIYNKINELEVRVIKALEAMGKV